MRLYGLFVYNRFGTCIFHDDCSLKQVGRGGAGGSSTGAVWTPTAKEEDKFALAAGLVQSIRYFIQEMSKRQDLGDGFFAFQTNQYKCHYFESQTGYRFVLLTDPGVPLADAKRPLHEIYALFVETVAKDPSYVHAKNAVIINPTFGAEFQRLTVSWGGAAGVRPPPLR